MLLTEWAKKRQRELDKLPGKNGVYAELERSTGLNYRTVLRAAKKRLHVTYEAAEKLSAATGGVCSIDEIRFPQKHGAAPPVEDKPKKKPKRAKRAA